MCHFTKIFRQQQPDLVTLVLLCVDEALLVKTVDANGCIHVHPFTQLACVGGTDVGHCYYHIDRFVLANLILIIRFARDHDLGSTAGATCFHPDGNRYICVAVMMQHFRTIMANFAEVYHQALGWTKGRCALSVYLDRRIVLHALMFRVKSFHGMVVVPEARCDKDIVKYITEYLRCCQLYNLFQK